MDFELTIHAGSRATAVRVTGGQGQTAAQLRAALSTALGVPVDYLCAGGHLVPEDARVGYPPMVHGASLVVEVAPRESATAPMSLWTLDVISGPDAGRSAPLASPVQFGRASSCQLVIADDSLSREHATVSVTAERICVTDHESTNGVDVGQGPSTGPQDLPAGGALRAGSSTLQVRRAQTGSLPLREAGDGYLIVDPTPRHTPHSPPVSLEPPVAPTPENRSGMPWVPALIPLPLAGVMAIFLGPQLLWFAVMSPLMMLGSALNDRVGRRRREREARERHTRACEDYEQALTHGLLSEAESWQSLAPDPALVLDRAIRRAPGLWSRVREDSAWGVVRVGWGDPPSERLAIGRWGRADADHPRHSHAPVNLPLLGPLVTSVVGAPGERIPLLRNIIGQLCVHHDPGHLRITVVTDEGWEWTRLLPHTAGAPTPVTEVEQLLGQLPTGGDGEHLVVIPQVADLPGLTDVIDACRSAGVSVLLGSDEALSTAADSVIDVAGDGARLRLTRKAIPGGGTPIPEDIRLCVDGVGWWWSERLARALAPLRSAGMPPATGQPATLRELLGEEPRWGSGDAAVATVALARGLPWSIDLDADGPHLLVGGTTGSGKSEFLRALVMSLAMRSAPNVLSFVLVDYKGGASFGACASLPHTVGLLTDLEGGHAERALASLRAEIARRERLLARHHVTDRSGYLAAVGADEDAKALLPRLVIVIDEFRALAVEHPDVLAGIVHAAAIGRSLGVHLILATQRPSGVISAEIQANVNLRIALRMRDKHDSQDVIDCADAATLSPDRPGSGIARGGDGALVAFQTLPISGHTPRREADLRVTRPDAPTPAAFGDPVEPDDLDALTSRLREVSEHGHLPVPGPVWLPPLPQVMTEADAHALLTLPPEPIPDTSGLVGVIDVPALQRYAALSWRRSSGHWLVVGAPRSGRSTTARSVIAAARRQSAREGRPLHVHVIDTAGDWTGQVSDPGLGTITGPHEPRRLARFLDRLDREIDQRRAAPREGGNLAHLLIVIDGLDRLDGTDRFAPKPLTDRVMRVLTHGPGVGVTLLITGDRSLLTGPVADAAEEMLILPLSDPTDLVLVGLGRADAPREWTAGHAVRVGGAQAQHTQIVDTGWDLGASDDPGMIGEPPWVVEDLPAAVETARLPASDCHQLVLGVGGEPAQPEVWRPDLDGRAFALLGRSRSGRSTAIATLALAAAQGAYPVAVVCAGPTGPFAALRQHGIHVLDLSDVETLVALRTANPNLVVCVDDAERSLGSPIEPVLEEILAVVDRDAGLVIAALDPAVVASHYRGFALAVTRTRRGFVFCPQNTRDGDLLGASTLPVIEPLPGRAFRVGEATLHEVQFALPSTDSRGQPSSRPREPVGARPCR